MEPGGRGAWHEPGLPRWSRRAVLRCGSTRMPSTGHRRQTTDRGAKKTIVAPLFGKRRSCGRATTRVGYAGLRDGAPSATAAVVGVSSATGRGGRSPRCGSTSLLVEAPKGERAGYLQSDGQSNAIRSQTSSPRNLENRVRRRARDCRPCRLSARKRHLQSLPTDGPSPTVARGTVAVCEKATGVESGCARRALGYSQNPLCTARACSTR
jgi:hypothetical protein